MSGYSLAECTVKAQDGDWWRVISANLHYNDCTGWWWCHVSHVTPILVCQNALIFTWTAPITFYRPICLLQHHICKFTTRFCLVAAYCSSSCADVFSSDVHEWKWSVHVSLQPQNDPADHSLQQLQHVCLGPEGGQQRQAEVSHAVSSWLMTHHVYSASFYVKFPHFISYVQECAKPLFRLVITYM